MITAIIMMFVVGAVLGLILGIASNVFKVEVDERVEKVTAMLPGYNCGSCGFAGCSGMAEAMVAGRSCLSFSLQAKQAGCPDEDR